MVSRVTNLMPSRYREVAVTSVDLPLVPERLKERFLGREAYRRTRYIGRPCRDGVALLEVAKASEEPLFSPITESRCWPVRRSPLAHHPGVDVGVPTQICREALAGARTRVAWSSRAGTSRELHPRPGAVPLRVVGWRPPQPPNLLDQARRVRRWPRIFRPVRLEPEIVDIVELARQRPSRQYLYPCRGSGAAPEGAEVFYLDERPSRRDWVLVGCERSREIHRHFYGDDPPYLEMCPHELVVPGDGSRADQVLPAEEIERDGLVVRVPWGATLAEVRAGIETVIATVEPTWAPS